MVSLGRFVIYRDYLDWPLCSTELPGHLVIFARRACLLKRRGAHPITLRDLQESRNFQGLHVIRSGNLRVVIAC